MLGLFTDPGDLGDGAHGSSFAVMLRTAVRDAQQQRGRLTRLSTREDVPAPRVGGHRVDIVTVCNGIMITDKRRVH
jgi:hypothetical protein